MTTAIERRRSGKRFEVSGRWYFEHELTRRHPFGYFDFLTDAVKLALAVQTWPSVISESIQVFDIVKGERVEFAPLQGEMQFTQGESNAT